MAENRQRPQRRKPNTKLYGLRINRGWSREDLAYRTGLSRQTIRLAEGGYVPGPRVQFAIAEQFDLRPLDLWPLEQQKVLIAA